MSRKDKKTNLLVDGDKLKVISSRDKEGKEKWVKYQPINVSGETSYPHYIHNQTEQNHLDIYKDSKEVRKNRDVKIQPAGVAICFGESKEIVTLPQIPISKEEFDKMSVLEKCEEFAKRVKFI